MLADLLTAINDHDRLTRGHSERVRAYTEVIGDEMDLPESEMNLLRWGALLHDVGKLTVPAEILNKDGPPNDAEWEVLQGHPTAGGAILAAAQRLAGRVDPRRGRASPPLGRQRVPGRRRRGWRSRCPVGWSPSPTRTT